MRMFLNDAASPHSFACPRDDKGPKSVGGETKPPGRRPRMYVSQQARCSLSRLLVVCRLRAWGEREREFRALSRLFTRGGYEDGKDQRQHFHRLLGQVGRLEPWYVTFQASAERNEQ